MTFSEGASRALITVGGIGTIAAVALIFVFLLWVVVPLFTAPTVEAAERLSAGSLEAPRAVLIDEYQLLASTLDADGTLRTFDFASGEKIGERKPLEQRPSAVSLSPEGRDFAAGFEDGSVRIGRFGYRSYFPPEAELAPELRAIEDGVVVRYEDGVLQRVQDGALRFQGIDVELSDPLSMRKSTPIERIAHTARDDGMVLCVWTDGGLIFVETEERTNFLTGEVVLDLSETELAYEPDPSRGTPDYLLLVGRGDNVLLLWEDGRLERVDVRDPESASVVEVVDVVPADGEVVTALSFLIGKSTLVVGDSTGAVRSWFRIKPEAAGTPDGTVFVPAHRFGSTGSAVTALAPSPRSRLISVGREDGTVQIYQATTEALLVELEVGPDAIRALSMSPKEDGLCVLTAADEVMRWDMDPRHPEADLTALFAPVWYEGYEQPAHVWQSESGTDEFEPKLGFLPLIYGTLKATLYSMLFGAPLALFAALYTSEFLSRRLRTPIKSIIEMMASLPSVVLGFLAALVIAPVAQTVVPATLVSFVTLPLALLLGAYLWQLLPQRLSIRWSGWQRLCCMGLALPVGVLSALALGPWVEGLLFAGNIELWLDGQRGNGVGGWLILLLPLCALLWTLFGGRALGPWMRRRSANWSRHQCAVLDIAKFGVGIAASIGVALLVSSLLDGAGYDPRGSYVGTYVQRNALIVGFVMGFAIIPIIYTLAEDALSSVPEHLRLASLGAGATPWQTAVRVIVPTAMSGLFSAVMIGLGRAVGETMIVLMATGNTPVMDMNIFNGFRTLSANIAVELPEAVQNSTHYRALFLAALVLFAMTFTLNTLAELVRLRFRKRAVQL